MATNYEQNQTAATVSENLKTSTISESTQNAIVTALGDAAATVQTFVAPPSAGELAGVAIATTGGGNVNLNNATEAEIKDLKAIVITDDTATNIQINNNNFEGTVVLGGGDSTVELKTDKAVTVETGAGDDKVTTGKGGDSVVISGGNDNVNTGAGNDKIDLKQGFSGDAVVNGGSGRNDLALGNLTVQKISTDSKGVLDIQMNNGGSVTAKNFQAIVLGNDKVEIDTTASKTALNVITGTGNDSVNLGGGKDSITLSGGNDTVDTGAGNDKLTIATDFKGNAVIDGGTGKNELDLTNVSKITTDASGSLVIKMDNGATVNATNFQALVLGDDAVSVSMTQSTTALNLDTGTGNDSISLGLGKDSIALSGGKDTINTGAGADLVKLATDFTGTTKLDGGEGNDKLDLGALAIKSVTVTKGVVNITLDNGAVVQATNLESFIYDTNGDAVGGIKTVGVTTLDTTF